MDAQRYKLDCALLGTKLCGFLGCDGCDRCVFKNGLDRKADAAQMESNWEVTLSYLPQDIDELHETDTCVFCGKNHADGFAELSLGHPEPEHRKGIILGLGKKVRVPVGSLVDIPIAVCGSCRRKMRYKDIVQIGGGVLVAAIAIAVMLIPGVEPALTTVHWAMPLLVFAGILAAGWTAVYFIAEAVGKRVAEQIKANPLMIPIVAEAIRYGWFPVPEVKRGYPRVHFTKHKLRENFRYFPKDDEAVPEGENA